jgi:hypothetical protein
MMSFLFSAPAFSHAGSHENKNCFITWDEKKVRFSGYQFQGLHPDEAFCHILPYLGDVIIKIDPVSASLSEQAIQLKVSSVFTQKTTDFSKIMPVQRFAEGVVMLQTDIQAQGLYRLSLQRYDKGQAIGTIGSFFFLVGIPVTQYLVLFSGAAFVFLLVIAGFSHYQRSKSAIKSVQ